MTRGWNISTDLATLVQEARVWTGWIVKGYWVDVDVGQNSWLGVAPCESAVIPVTVEQHSTCAGKLLVYRTDMSATVRNRSPVMKPPQG